MHLSTWILVEEGVHEFAFQGINTANFMGRTPFDVASAAAVTTSSITVTFDAAPVPSEAMNPNNYDIPGLALGSMPTLSGNTVTLVTSLQSASTYMVTVTGVHRASDGEPLVAGTVRPGSGRNAGKFRKAWTASVASGIA